MKIRKCVSCKLYTFKEFCPECKQKTVNPLPPNFSPQDKYGYWRRKLIQNDTEEKS